MALRDQIRQSGALSSTRGKGPLWAKGVAPKRTKDEKAWGDGQVSSVGYGVNRAKGSSRAGQAFRSFSKNGEIYHVYVHKGKRMVFKVGGRNQATLNGAQPRSASGTGGTAAP